MYMYGKMSRLQIWGLIVALVLVLHGARQTLANIAENKGDEGGGLRGEPRWLLRPWPTTAGVKKRIPCVIHRIDKAISPAWNQYEDSWRRLNPGWELNIWNDQSCLEFVRQEFPEYLSTYQTLGRNIERSDFFRYMVVLRIGGVYTDSDVECRKPLDQLIQPSDALIAGWEAEFPNATIARISEYARKRQVLQWTFAAVPGHPVLRSVCEHIKRHADKLFSEDEHYDVLERTGPGPWTDAVMKYAHLDQFSQLGVAWRVRVLPIVQMGIYPYRQDDWTPEFPEAQVLHKFQGTWKQQIHSKQQTDSGDIKKPRRQGPLYRPGFVDDEKGAIVKTEEMLPFDRKDEQRYPISIAWQPPFTMLVDLIGRGDVQAGSDVGAMLTRWGMWQPSLKHDRTPLVLEALIGGLESTGNQKNVLLDIGAGIGYYSLAASARGHQSIATELSASLTASFEASIQQNGFDEAINLHKVALGSHAEEICIGTDVPTDAEASRGYGLPELHDVALQADRCLQRAQRTRGARLVPHGVNVGAIRISGSGWEGWILEGLQELWTQKERAPPAVILLELYPEALIRKGYVGGTAAILHTLHAAGYADILHSGPGCNARQTAAYRKWSGMERQQEDMEEFTWCRLSPHHFSSVMERALYRDGQPENVLFTRKVHRKYVWSHHDRVWGVVSTPLPVGFTVVNRRLDPINRGYMSVTLTRVNLMAC